MAEPKQVTLWGHLAKLEGAYNGGGALVAGTDGQWQLEPFTADISFAHDGARQQRAPGTANTFKRLAQSGMLVMGSPKFEARGSGIAYSASVFPPDLHVWMRASGHSFATDVTGGAEKQTYSPQSLNDSSWSSIVMEGYARNQKYPIQGVYADMNWTVDGDGPMVFEFPFKGLGTRPTDVALPAITYQYLTVTPPKAESAVLSLGSFTAAVIRKVEFKKNQDVAGPRISQAAAVAGFAMGARNPTITFTVEAVTLTTSSPWSGAATLNPYALRDTALPFAISYQIGAAAVYNRIKFTAANAQVIDVKDDADGPTALWVITCELKPSSPILSDDYALAFINT